MTMFSKDEEVQNTVERCRAWVAELPEAQQHYFCEHGRYWGARGALRFMSPCCKV